MKGAKVCRMHGGSAPQVKRSAEIRRVTDLYGPAVGRLVKVLVKTDEEGDWRTLLRAIELIVKYSEPTTSVNIDLAALDDESLRELAEGVPPVRVLENALRRAKAEAHRQPEPSRPRLVPDPEPGYDPETDTMRL